MVEEQEVDKWRRAKHIPKEGTNIEDSSHIDISPFIYLFFCLHVHTFLLTCA